MVVSRMGLLELKMKLLQMIAEQFVPEARFACGTKLRIFWATVLMFVILLPGKAMRPPTKPVGHEGVEGSKI